ncbi:hypothetical protein HOA59_00620 [archaeon]|mgnify:FL=1|jgi:hypothetical protein|nr:hypothetical protein [archaeon]MBT6823923.1 hypothetical protein [archaeon]MBT7106829.1 hypothetical protein [archaeon]MBT7297500.1 hypothetical protein [archaeon]
MSYQRAIINCQRCYDSVSGGVKFGLSKPTDMVHELRNNAMESLEGVLSRISDNDPVEVVESCTTALTECLNCEYISPRIVEVLEEYISILSEEK